RGLSLIDAANGGSRNLAALSVEDLDYGIKRRAQARGGDLDHQPLALLRPEAEIVLVCRSRLFAIVDVAVDRYRDGDGLRLGGTVVGLGFGDLRFVTHSELHFVERLATGCLDSVLNDGWVVSPDVHGVHAAEVDAPH